jgi:hypothetical protein
MTIEMDLIATIFESHHWMANKMDSIIAIRFDYCHQMEIKKGDKEKTPSTIRMGD